MSFGIESSVLALVNSSMTEPHSIAWEANTGNVPPVTLSIFMSSFNPEHWVPSLDAWTVELQAINYTFNRVSTSSGDVFSFYTLDITAYPILF